MFAPSQGSRITLDCQVTRQDNSYTVSGTFQCHCTSMAHAPSPSSHGTAMCHFNANGFSPETEHDLHSVVSERCKHRSMSWTETGVLAIATYAKNSMQKSNSLPKFHTSS